ncbi:MAG: NAD(P)-binding domain-containing protein [Armatimonadaceae bacterium]
MVIGVIGSGNMGQAVGGVLARAGHEVLFSFSRDEARLHAVAEAAGNGARAVSPAEAAQKAEAIFLACPYPALEEALVACGAPDGALAGKLVLTCVSGLRPDFKGETVGLPTERTVSVAEEIAEKAVGAQVVEAFNTTFAEVIARGPDFAGLLPAGEGRPSVFYCGGDDGAQERAASLIRDCGFEPVYAGPLQVARSQETLASVWVQYAVVARLYPGVTLRALQG